MKIGFDVSALVKKATGIEQWIIHTIEGIIDLEKEQSPALQNEYYLFSYDKPNQPLNLPPNWHMVYYGGPKKRQFLYLTNVSRYLRQNHIDVFVGTRHYLPLFKSKGTKYIGVVHDLIPLYMPELFTREHLLRFKAFTKICQKNADLIIAVSEATKKDVLHYMHFPEEKVKVVYEGADLRFNTERDEESISATMKKYHIDSKYILCLSTVEPRKNMLRTIQAYEQCILDKNLPYKLVIVGGSGWNNGEIYDYVQQSEALKTHVIFTGYVSNEEVKHIYANATLFIYASLCEGFGLPILEAMQSGIPVITSNVSSMPEIAGDACDLVDPYNIEQLKEALERVLSSEDTRRAMRERGLERAKQFSWQKSSQEILHHILYS